MSRIRRDFNKIYDNYIDKIYRFVYVKVSSTDIAEDLTSETFLRFWEKSKDNSKKIDNPQAFLYQVARNLVIDHYREKGRTQIVSADNLSITDPQDGPREKSFINSELQEVENAMSGLKDEYKEVLIWYYLDEMSAPEISEITNKSEGAVRVQVHRALNALRKEIENKRKTA
jgi:RNA polymerase sigma factor (sigma-70 family)